MMNCEKCEKYSTCIDYCPKVKKILDNLSSQFYKAYRLEIPLIDIFLEYNVNKHPITAYYGQSTFKNVNIDKIYINLVHFILNTKLNKLYKGNCKKILYDYYFLKQSQKDISKKYGTAQSNISSYLKDITNLIRGYISDIEDVENEFIRKIS